VKPPRAGSPWGRKTRRAAHASGAPCRFTPRARRQRAQRRTQQQRRCPPEPRLTHLTADLVAALARLDVDDLTHGGLVKLRAGAAVAATSGCRARPPLLRGARAVRHGCEARGRAAQRRRDAARGEAALHAARQGMRRAPRRQRRLTWRGESLRRALCSRANWSRQRNSAKICLGPSTLILEVPLAAAANDPPPPTLLPLKN